MSLRSLGASNDSRDNEVSQLPSHTVRVSKRTQHVHLKITVAKGLEVILPKGMDRTSVPWILRANENWIARQLKRVEEQRKNVPGNLAAVSSQLKLRATGELWWISYLTFAAKTKLIERAGRELVLNCSPSDTATVRVLLEEWLRGRAREYLMPWLRRLSGEFRLPYARARIKSQQTPGPAARQNGRSISTTSWYSYSRSWSDMC